MRRLTLLALLVSLGASCKKETGPSSPGAPPSTKEQDALWELAPSGAKLGVVVSGRGLAMLESAWFAVKELIATAPELEEVDAKLERQLKRAIGTSDPKLSSLGWTADKGLAVFLVDEESLAMILPVVDREKFLDKVKGKKGSDGDRVDDMTCKDVADRYVCAKPASLLDKLGKGKLADRLEAAGARGDLEVAGTIPDARGKAPRIAVVGQLGRGTIVLRGEVDGLPEKVTDMFPKLVKPRSDGSRTSGFAVFDPRAFLEKMPRGKVVRGVTFQDLADSVNGPITVTTPNGEPIVDLRVPLSDTEPFEKVIGQCDEIRPLAKLGAKVKGDVCKVTLPEVGLEVEAWIDGKELRVGKRKGSSGGSSPMSSIGEEIADGEWSFATWGHGTLFAYDDAPFLQSVSSMRAPKEALMGVRAMAMISEVGLAAKVVDEKVKFVATVRTVWSNPDEVVAKLVEIKIEDLLRGRTAKRVKEIASDHPSTPFAADHTAGSGGLVAMLAPIGVAAAVAIPMFLDTMKKPKKSEAMLQLEKISKSARAYYVQHASFPVGGGRRVIPAIQSYPPVGALERPEGASERPEPGSLYGGRRAAAPVAVPLFPGATLVVDAEGRLTEAWYGPASPIAPVTTGVDIFAALDVEDTTPDAARAQMLLASACGAIATAWPLLAGDAPPTLVRRDGSVLGVMWSPIAPGPTIDALALFVAAGASAITLAGPAEDPVETNRICVDALGLLDECDACVRHLRSDPSARHLVHRMFRAVHTIKGSTRGTSLRVIADLAHASEERLDLLRGSDEPAHAGTVVELEADLKALRAAVATSRPRGEIDDAMTEMSSECRHALSDLRLSLERMHRDERSAVEPAARAITRISDAADRAKLRALGIQCTAARNAIAMIADAGVIDPSLLGEIRALEAHVELYTAVYREVAASDAGPSVLVTLGSLLDAPADRSGSLDGLVDVMSHAGVPSLVAAFVDEDPFAMRRALGVLVDASAMFEPARPRDDASLRFERAQRDLLAALDGLREVPPASLADIRAIVQRLVWTPLASIGRRLPRMARTLSAELGKNVAVEIDLGDLLVAPEIGRVIGEILVHAVRNAADHGIEAPCDRLAAGKDGTGTITVTATSTAERVRVEIRDDGRGVPLERVRRTAVARGLVTQDAAELLSPDEVVDMLFVPGFSTATSVTAVSGRGVGMDVIKSLAEAHGGTVTMTSATGIGTQLLLELPLSPP